MTEIKHLTTEKRNPRTLAIDEVETEEILRLMNEEDAGVAFAVKKILPQLAAAVDETSRRLATGGRLFLQGAGTSGRLGVLDAVECPITFGAPAEMMQGVIAGGEGAMFRAQPGVEDDATEGKNDLMRRGLSPQDVLVGIAASGRTPYVIGGLEYAAEVGAFRIALATTERAAIFDYADICLNPVTGPEAVTGSTRLKAGTAQKMVLNMLTAATMIKLGKVYSNLLVDMQATNEKLRARILGMVQDVTGETEEVCAAALVQAKGNAKLAIFTVMTGQTPQDGAKALSKAGGRLREALNMAKKSATP